MPSLPYWLFPGDDRPPAEIDDEIAEELHLHLDLLAEEQMLRGVAPDQAKQRAVERFGDYDTLLRQCRAEKQGDIPMLKRIQAVLIGVLAAAVVAMGWQQWTMATQAQATWRVMNGISDRLSSIQDKLVLMQPNPSNSGPTWQQPTSNADWQATRSSPDSQPLPPTAANSYDAPVVHTGRLKPLEFQFQDTEGNPLTNAVITTWRSSIISRRGEPEFLDLSASNPVDDQGRYTPHSPVEGYAVVAPGFVAYASSLKNSQEINSRILQVLAPSAPVRIQVRLTDGSPARYASIILARRTNIHDHSSNFPPLPSLICQQTDDEGKATLDWLQAGDLATVLVKQRGKPIDSATTVEFEAPSDASKVVLINLTGRSRWGGEEFGGEFGGSDASKDYEIRVGEVSKEPAEKPSRRRRRGGDFGGDGFGGGEFGGGVESRRGGFGGEFGGTTSAETTETELAELAEAAESQKSE